MLGKTYLLRLVLIVIGMVLLLRADYTKAEAIVAEHTSVNDFDMIPSTYFDQIRTNYKIFYGHTSHGSQIVTGLNVLESENTLYAKPYFHEVSDDLGHNGDLTWVPITSDYLDANPDINVVMWSWCGGCSDNTPSGIQAYLDAMNTLETSYPGVIFIYMTGHLDGSGPIGPLYINNNQIRDYCILNSKVLFDFADIESYDPDGTYYPDASDDCAWCTDWCTNNPPCPDCSCAHSHCFNCYMKGKAFWWMMASLSGWEQESCCVGIRGNANSDEMEAINISDITYLVSYCFGSGPAPECLDEGDVNSDENGSINISDITFLVSYCYGSGAEPLPCPGVVILSADDCKSFSETALEDIKPNQDCIEYSYDGESTLHLKHINTGFNCCPRIKKNVRVEGNVIIIEEIEIEGLCDCLCLFDLDYDVTNITPGEYIITVEEPLVQKGDVTLEFAVNLTTNPTGIFCVERNYYPWGVW